MLYWYKSTNTDADCRDKQARYSIYLLYWYKRTNTDAECCDELGGCFLGQYRRDKIGVALMELLRRNNLCPEHANCPIDEH